MRMLIIEDNRTINDNIKFAFVSEGFAVDQAFDGKIAEEKALLNPYDLMIIDINIPIKSGMEVLKSLRAKSITTPAIFLTANDDMQRIEEAYGLNADDYLIKPFSLKILVLKAKSIIKRATMPQNNNVYKYGNVSINLHSRVVTNKKININLTGKEFAIIEYLILNTDRFVSQEELIEHVWNEENDPFSGSIRVHISNLRQKLGNIIETKKGLGYKMISENK